MVFLRSSLSADEQPVLFGKTVTLRPPAAVDYAAWADLRARSRDHLVPWEPQWDRDELERNTYRRRLKLYAQEARDDLGHAFFIFAPTLVATGGDAPHHTLVGGLRLSNIRRGVSQAATIGYWLGLPHVGRGYMAAAVAAIIPFGFDKLGLHRLEAACLADNARSQRVLERNGFEREGIARDYIKINGVWRDHILYALIARGEQRV